MKRIILMTLLFLTAGVLRADDHSQEILRKMAAAFNSYTSYQVEFTATMAGEFEGLPGELIVCGDKYYLDVYDSEIFFDGKTGYTYSESNDEVILETPDPNDYRLFANPSKIFQIYEQDFSSAYKGLNTVDGKRVAVLELTPKSAEAGFNTLVVYANPATGMPVRMVYHLGDVSRDMVLDVVKITPNVSVTSDTFIFDPTKFPGVDIIDFR